MASCFSGLLKQVQEAKRQFMQIRVVYHTEKPAALVEVTEVVPGLCIGRNPAYQEYGLRKWAVFHSPSADRSRDKDTASGTRAC